METTEIQHPNFIWTWKESTRGQRQSIWIPYLTSIDKIPRSKRWKILFNGGEYDADLAKLDFIMLYGASGSLPVEFLDALNAARVCLSVHRRNMPRPYLFIPSSGADNDDVLSPQIVARLNEKSAAYVARTLIRERFASMEYLIPISGADYKKLAAMRNVDSVRQLDAVVTARYWAAYFAALGLPGDTTRRGDEHPVSMALDACSFFLQGILLRWILFHKLSPFHGFLHRPTAYPALVFDLIEPYRRWTEECVADAVRECGAADADTLINIAIARLKQYLDDPVYVPATRQTVRRKSLLHGIVLALRAWLVDAQTRLVFPVEGVKKGGRPPAIGFSIPGYKIGE